LKKHYQLGKGDGSAQCGQSMLSTISLLALLLKKLAFILVILIALFDVSAASFGKNVAVLDFVNPSPHGEYVSI